MVGPLSESRVVVCFLGQEEGNKMADLLNVSQR